MVEIVFQKVILGKIGDVGGLNVGDISRREDSNVHCQLYYPEGQMFYQIEKGRMANIRTANFNS